MTFNSLIIEQDLKFLPNLMASKRKTVHKAHRIPYFIVDMEAEKKISVTVLSCRVFPMRS